MSNKYIIIVTTVTGLEASEVWDEASIGFSIVDVQCSSAVRCRVYRPVQLVQCWWWWRVSAHQSSPHLLLYLHTLSNILSHAPPHDRTGQKVLTDSPTK